MIQRSLFAFFSVALVVSGCAVAEVEGDGGGDDGGGGDEDTSTGGAGTGGRSSGGSVGTGGQSSGGSGGTSTGGADGDGGSDGDGGTGGGTGGTASGGGGGGSCPAAWTQQVYATAGEQVSKDNVVYEVCYYTQTDPSDAANHGSACTEGKPWIEVGPC
jgi:hypothetical protein